MVRCKGIADRHTSDGGHWLAMTLLFTKDTVRAYGGGLGAARPTDNWIDDAGADRGVRPCKLCGNCARGADRHSQ